MNGTAFDRIAKTTGLRMGRRGAALALAGVAASFAGAAASAKQDGAHHVSHGSGGHGERGVETERRDGGNGGKTCAGAGKRCKRSSECCGGRCAGTGKRRKCVAGGNSGNPGAPGGPGACVPRCDGRTCGPDGCGGSCGTCPAGAACCNGTCAAPAWTRTGAFESGPVNAAISGDGSTMVALDKLPDGMFRLLTLSRNGDAPDAWTMVGEPGPIPMEIEFHLSMDGLTLWASGQLPNTVSPRFMVYRLTRASRDVATWQAQSSFAVSALADRVAANADGTLVMTLHRAENLVVAWRRTGAGGSAWTTDGVVGLGTLNDPRDVRLSADGQTALIVEAEGAVTTWRRGVGQWFRAGQFNLEGDVPQVALSPDGKRAWAISGGDITIWEQPGDVLSTWRNTGTFARGELIYPIRISVNASADTAWVFDDGASVIKVYQLRQPGCR